MELKVNDYQLPEVIQFNFEELKRELTEKVQKYETIVYTDEQIKEAKADKAQLNKLKKALNDERIRREREYMEPFNEFKNKVNEIIEIIEKPVGLIDQQLKEFEEKRKADKRVEIGTFWTAQEKPEWLTLPNVFDEKWLNASYSIKQVEKDIETKLNVIKGDLITLESLDDFAYEAVEAYKRTLDVNFAIAEGKRLADLQKRKEQAQAEAQAKTEEPAPAVQQEEKPAEPAGGQWVNFSAFLTMAQAIELKTFFENRNIKFKPL